MAATLAPVSAQRPRDLSDCSPLLWWHLLSLDAPTIAGLWCWTFARAFSISLPWFGLVTLCLGTWCVYVTDRLLDGWHSHPGIPLRERHLFYSRHRQTFLAALSVATLPLAYLIFVRVTPSVRTDDIWLAILGLIYFAAIHNSKIQAWVPKEVIVGIVFSTATVVPCWSRFHGQEHWMILCAVLFAGMCCWNCIAIQIWEDARAGESFGSAVQHRLTQWAGKRLHIVAAGLAMIPACAAVAAPTTGVRILLASCSFSGVVFLVLDRIHSRIEGRTLRIAVDVALLTPFLWMSLVN